MIKTSWIVFTDLDGTLLDHHTYSYEAARPALAWLRERSIPVVLCSSKTAAEMLPLHRELRLEAPFIVENGGGIYGWSESLPCSDGFEALEDYPVLSLGRPYSELRSLLQRAEEKHRVKIHYFDDMTPEELSRNVGLSVEESRRALKREFDVPFQIEERAIGEALREECEAAGLTLTTGGRFWHLMGGSDKGRAVCAVREAYARGLAGTIRTLGLGDSSNDAPMLDAVDQPVLIPNPESSSPPQSLPENTYRAKKPGPEGWCEAIQQLIKREAS